MHKSRMSHKLLIKCSDLKGSTRIKNIAVMKEKCKNTLQFGM